MGRRMDKHVRSQEGLAFEAAIGKDGFARSHSFPAQPVCPRPAPVAGFRLSGFSGLRRRDARLGFALRQSTTR